MTRIVIDMQGAQSTGSRNRGIGRYTRSLVAALLRQDTKHQIVLVFNGYFADTISEISIECGVLLSPESLCVWHAEGFETPITQEHSPWRVAAELTYEAFLLSHEPDLILVTSLFEGLTDPTVTSIHGYQVDVPVAVVLYDLIPYTNPVPYLENPLVKAWYLEKVQHLKRADLLLSISEYSRQEAIEAIGFDTRRVVNIATDADAHFKKVLQSPQQAAAVRQSFGLLGDFVMYTGGADYRKNIEGLIKAYAKMPADVRLKTQLAIVCAMPDLTQEHLVHLATTLGLDRTEVVFTGYVSEADLNALYNLCSLFVFPSFQEGFGLPALEAIRCGAPVIGSNRSSIPEVIGWTEALFDPYSVDSIADLMKRALTDQAFRTALKQRQSAHVAQFSWDDSAKRALSAIESELAARVLAKQEEKETGIGKTTTSAAGVAVHNKPKLAFFSPLPPSKSGIADYSAMLLPALTDYYDIDVIVQQDEVVSDDSISKNISIRSLQWFEEHFEQFDRVVYQFGNSTFHQHMFEWLEKIPGVVVLHDFFLSGILAHKELHGHAACAWTRSLYSSHGYQAVYDRFAQPDLSQTIWRYPANLDVLQQALGTIVHTEHSRAMAKQWYGQRHFDDWQIVPLVRSHGKQLDKAAAKRALGFADTDLVVCSFGMINPTKLNQETLSAWQASAIASEAHAHLIFVGENDPGPYGAELLRRVQGNQTASRVSITGWLEPARYTTYLNAADMAIQLRTKSRGETSAAVLDCMNYGIATIANAHGSMQALDDSAVKIIPDQFEIAELAQAITQFQLDPTLRQSYGNQARSIIAQHHTPEACARGYFEAIERFYQDRSKQLPRVCRAISQLGLDTKTITAVAGRLAQTFPPSPREARCLIDVTHLGNQVASDKQHEAFKQHLNRWQAMLSGRYRVEPVYADPTQNRFRFAEKLACQSLGIPHAWTEDQTVEPWPGDLFVSFESCASWLVPKKELLLDWRNRIGGVWLVVKTDAGLGQGADAANHKPWVELLDVVTGLICQTPEQLLSLQAAVDQHTPAHKTAVKLAVGHPTGAEFEAITLKKGLGPFFSDSFE